MISSALSNHTFDISGFRNYSARFRCSVKGEPRSQKTVYGTNFIVHIMGRDLDDVDRSILYMLQQDARNSTAQDIADRAGVSASTVRNRIDQLEADGIIEGYHPEINYEAANLPLQVTFIVSASPIKLEEYSEKLRGIQGVIDVREMLTGRRNLHIDVVGTSTTDLTRITDAIHELGVEIESSEMMRRRHVQPFNHFFLQGSEQTSAHVDDADIEDSTN